MARLIWLAILAAILEALTGCATLTTIVDQRRVESTEQLGVLVGAAPTVTIIVPNGSVKLHVGEAGRVAAVATRRGYGESDAAARAAHDGLEVAFTQRGDAVTLEARRLHALGQAQSDEAELDVTVPAGSAVEIRVANGEIVATPPGGNLRADMQNGTITLSPAKDDSFSFSAAVTNGTIQSAFAEIAPAAGQNLAAEGRVGAEAAYTITATCANGIVALNKAR